VPKPATPPATPSTGVSRSAASRASSAPRQQETPPTPPSSSAPPRAAASRGSRDVPPPQKAPEAPAESGVPNVNRIMANLRKQIQQKLPNVATPSSSASTSRPRDEIHRFYSGQRIFCLPYGDGEVVDSFFVDGREYIRVDFPNYGELKIDPSLSLVKVVSDTDTSDSKSDIE